MQANGVVWCALQVFTAYTAKEAEFELGFLPLHITEPFNASVFFSA